MADIQFTDIEQARKYVASDFVHMVEYCTKAEGFQPVEFQLALADWLQSTKREWIAPSKVILGFRYSMKTFLTRCYVLWRWLRVPSTKFIIHSSNDDMAMEFAGAILTALRSNPLMSHLAPPPTSAAGHFNVAGVTHEIGYSLEAAGIMTSMTGKRCDVYIMDDPESAVDPESRRTRIIQAMEQAKFILYGPGRPFSKINMAIPDPELTQLLVLGQPHTERTAYYPDADDPEEADAHPLADAQYMVVPFLRRDGSWTYPNHPKFYDHVKERMKTTEEIMRGFTKRTWRLEMQCDITPIAGKANVIDPSLIEVGYKLTDRACIFLDPADSETGCETGISIVGVFKNKLHICYMGGIRGETYEGDVEDGSIGESIWAHIFALAEEFKVSRIYIEKNYKAAAAACRRYQRKANTTIPVEEYHVTGNKLRRITEALEQPFNNRMVSANPEVVADRENMRQLSKLTYYKLPSPNDRLDALAKGFSVLIELAELTDPGDEHDLIMEKYDSPQQTVRISTLNRYGSGLRLVQ